jgi:hypothetical protein
MCNWLQHVNGRLQRHRHVLTARLKVTRGFVTFLARAGKRARRGSDVSLTKSGMRRA